MLRKRISVLLLTFLFCLTSVVPAFAENNNTAIGKLTEIEIILYGTEQRGSLVERIESIEEDINGSPTEDSLLTRIDRAHSYIKGSSNSTVPSFMTKLNAVEWAFTEKLGTGPAKGRLEDIENVILGRSDSGSLDDRMDVLLAMVFDDGDIDVQQVIIPKDTLIKISMAQPLSSKTSREGDKVLFRAEDNVFVGDVLALPKGAIGNGYLSKVSRARNFGRNARIEIEYTDLIAIDNTQVSIVVGDLAEEATKSLATAAGVSVAGMIVLGPVGIVGGAFIKGKEYNIPEGAMLYVQIKEDTLVNGIYLPDSTRQKIENKEDTDVYGGL